MIEERTKSLIYQNQMEIQDDHKVRPEPFLTPQELADWLNMSRVWVYKQAEKGLLPFHRIGECIRFDPEEIRAYLGQRKEVKRTYNRSRNPKGRKNNKHLVAAQEATKKQY